VGFPEWNAHFSVWKTTGKGSSEACAIACQNYAVYSVFSRQLWRHTVKSLSLTECIGCFSQHMQFATVMVALFKTWLHISDILLQASIKDGSLYPEVMEIINGKVKPTLLSSSSVFTLVIREQANNGPRLLNTAHAEPWADTIKTWHTYSMQGSACMRHPNHLMLASASCWLMVHVTTPSSTIVLHKPVSPIQRLVRKGEFIIAFTNTLTLVPQSVPR